MAGGSRGTPSHRSSLPRLTGLNANPLTSRATHCCSAPPCCPRRLWAWASPPAMRIALDGRRTSGRSSTSQEQTPWSCPISTSARPGGCDFSGAELGRLGQVGGTQAVLLQPQVVVLLCLAHPLHPDATHRGNGPRVRGPHE